MKMTTILGWQAGHDIHKQEHAGAVEQDKHQSIDQHGNWHH